MDLLVVGWSELPSHTPWTARIAAINETELKEALAAHQERLAHQHILYLAAPVNVFPPRPTGAASAADLSSDESAYLSVADECHALNLEYIMQDLRDKPYTAEMHPQIAMVSARLRQSDLAVVPQQQTQTRTQTPGQQQQQGMQGTHGNATQLSAGGQATASGTAAGALTSISSNATRATAGGGAGAGAGALNLTAPGTMRHRPARHNTSAQGDTAGQAARRRMLQRD